ncbi:alanine racemase C-terminal domain-containing protein [Microbacterium kunmingense]|uniref:alanine racemase C-terminal domain-containing protein n=1 Tax=Microbacterium kunmingense TaxID=2915939 RepID=UPI003D720D58
MSVDPLRPSTGRPAGASGVRDVAAERDVDHRPVARIAIAAIEHNLRRAREAGFLAVDREVLNADGWGHGTDLVAGAVASSGLGWAPVGEKEERGVLGGSGVFGLPGSSARPVMSLVGRVIATKSLRAGEGVSYGYTFRAATDTAAALVTGGYGQGVIRELGSRVTVRVAGRDALVIGRVAMDVCVVDLGADGVVAPGTPVAFFGDPDRGEPSLAAWTSATDLGADEIVSIVGVRARRETT